MTRAPEVFTTTHLRAERITSADLSFVSHLMARPEMNTHKPDPTPPSPAKIAQTHAYDLHHWSRHGFGRYVVHLDADPIGLCGLTLREGMTGLNLSYHLEPDHWGQGHATTLVHALLALASDHLSTHAHVFALVRPANPGSLRVLTKSGFCEAETLMLHGAPTTRYTRELDRAQLHPNGHT